MKGDFLHFLLGIALLLPMACGLSKQSNSPPLPTALSTCIESTGSRPQGLTGAPPAPASSTSEQTNPTTTGQIAEQSGDTAIPPSQQQPKRILGVMPNFRAVSVGEIQPPPTAKQAFIIATKNSFDYSAFVFVGMTSALAEWTNAHPQLGQGMPGYGQYYWRGFLDKTTGNYFVIFAYPTIFHHDECYYALGKDGLWKRATYAATRIFVARDYQGHNVLNVSELLGRATSQSISLSYYPSRDQTAGRLAVKFGYALGRDALTNVFREFWPDIATHVLHRHP